MKIYKPFNRLSSGTGRAWRRADEATGCTSIELPPQSDRGGGGGGRKLLETQITHFSRGCVAQHTGTYSAAQSVLIERLLYARRGARCWKYTRVQVPSMPDAQDGAERA